MTIQKYVLCFATIPIIVKLYNQIELRPTYPVSVFWFQKIKRLKDIDEVRP